ncbi:MAG: hypothetical protein E7321_09645 [Clostridiales bacterium]|nr:hypothetical protein [Clostridiales bacterium]
MASKIDRIEAMLKMALGEELLARCPDLAYAVNQSLVRFMRTDATLPQLAAQIDSAVFNAVYTGTGGTMVATLSGGRRVRLTSAFISDLADRLLALAYSTLPVSPSVQEALYDFSREGSFAAMRELIRRFPMDAQERAYYMQVLRENGQEK